MEERKDFINRMNWMISEIKQSKLDDTNILSMIEFQLKQREQDLIKDVKRQVIATQEVSNERSVTNRYIIKKGNDKFLDIIDRL